MIYESIRAVLVKGGVTKDVTLELQDKKALIDFDMGPDDKLYLGSYFPFNNLYFDLKASEEGETQNDSELKIGYYDGNQFLTALDILDATKTGVKTMAHSGQVVFSQDIYRNTMYRVTDTRDTQITDLKDRAYFDLYWHVIQFSDQLASHTQIRRIGYAFTSDEKLRQIRAEVDQYLSSFGNKLGEDKKNWLDEILLASKMVVTDLKKGGMILSREQVVSFDDFWMPTTYKALELIYSQLGRGYDEEVTRFRHLYHKTFSSRNVQLDKGADGRKTSSNYAATVSTGTR